MLIGWFQEHFRYKHQHNFDPSPVKLPYCWSPTRGFPWDILRCRGVPLGCCVHSSLAQCSVNDCVSDRQYRTYLLTYPRCVIFNLDWTQVRSVADIVCSRHCCCWRRFSIFVPPRRGCTCYVVPVSSLFLVTIYQSRAHGNWGSPFSGRSHFQLSPWPRVVWVSWNQPVFIVSDCL